MLTQSGRRRPRSFARDLTASVVLAGCTVSVLLGGLPSQSALAAEDTPADSGSTLAEVVITARKRDEAAIDVPISISTLSSAQMEQEDVLTVGDIPNLVPAMHYFDRGNLQTEISIRGVGGDARNPGIDTGVGMYVDGVYIPRTSGYNSDLSDIDHIEVLEGPQGTLFGKNTIGGVVNIITRQPGPEAYGFLYTSFGNYGAVRTQASYSTPITDELSVKATVSTWQRDGYIYDPILNENEDDEDRRGGRLQVRYVSGPNEVRFSFDGTRDRTNDPLNQIGSPAGAAAPYYTGNRFEIENNQRNSDDRDMLGASLTVDHKFDGDYTLTSISAYRTIDVDVYSDIDQTPLSLFSSGPYTDDTRMLSQELRLVSPGNSAFRYVAGLFFYRQDVSSYRNIAIGTVDSTIVDDASSTMKSSAGYFNADYDVLNDLTVTGGLRYNHDVRTASYDQNYLDHSTLTYDFPNLARTDNNLSWTGSVKYKIDQNTAVYTTVSKGFKAGGFDLDTFTSPGLTARSLEFAPESVINYEVGIKQDLTGLVHWDAALFNMNYKNKQVSEFTTPPGGTLSEDIVTNAGAARIRGAEFDASVKAGSLLTFTANGSILDAKYTSFPNGDVVDGVSISYTGHTIENTPRWTAALLSDYRQPVTRGFAVANLTVTYTGDTDLEPDNLPLNHAGGYALFDGRAGFENKDGSVGVYLWGKNMANKGYLVLSRQFAGLDQVLYGEPRTYGIEGRYKF
jgi:iron complex outermembrane receptor protein